MAWGDNTADTQKTGVSNTIEYFTGITLNPGELCQCQLGIDNESGSVTDDLKYGVYCQQDGTNWDDSPIWEAQYTPSGVSQEWITFIVSGVSKFRVGVESSSTTDDYTVDFNYKKDGVNL